MGQTLTHGVYLPDEGERNCYNGLASNWSILDGAVGTIAEHTTALAGKAPAVHTHTKSDITDFPAFGNAAGTICEGNDSRLSDARTPVSHTHTKSDVTDLFNSNFIPSANNSYDLGSSSYQWNNVYAKQYYLNGTSFGDIATHNDSEYVHKTGNETVGGNKTWTGVNNIKNSDFNFSQNFILGDGSTHLNRLQFYDSVATRWGVFAYRHNTDNSTEAQMGLFALKSDNTITNQYITFLLANNGDAAFRPFYANQKISLGTSTNKWKTLNGINPGALSLPDLANAINIDTTGWVYDGATANSWTATVDCWVTVYSIYARLFILKNTTLAIGSVSERAGSYTNYVFVPARKGDVIAFTANGASDVTVIAYPCQGNV